MTWLAVLLFVVANAVSFVIGCKCGAWHMVKVCRSEFKEFLDATESPYRK